MQFRKKPVVVNAFKWTYDVVPDWWRNLIGIMIDVATESAFIPTLEGTMEARKGDMIIQGVNGEVYPCKPDIFAKTYEPADEAPRLQEAAEWEAVAFANFVGDRALPEYSKSLNKWRWWNNKGAYEEATTEELYTLFTQSNPAPPKPNNK